MKKALLAVFLAGTAFGAAGVQQTISQLGTSGNWVLAFNWTAGSNGSVPVTPAKLQGCCNGYFITQVETVPGTPSPTAGYSVRITDSAGVDALAGAAVNLGSTAQAFSALAPPIQGNFSLVLTGNSVANSQGTVFVFLSSTPILGFTGPLSVPANWVTMTNPPVFDVRTYGADPTGVADSTVAIQAAATAAEAVNGEILIPIGSFKVSSKITLCSNWQYSSVVGIGRGSIIAPTTSFPQTSSDPTAAVFNTDCGSSGQPVENIAGPSFRDFQIVFPQNFGVANRTLLAHWTGLNLNDTLDANVQNVAIVSAWDGISYKGTYASSAWQAYTGRSHFENLDISAYDIGISIDGSLDSNYFRAIHLWPFGNIGSNWLFNAGVVGIQVGRADDQKFEQGLCYLYQCFNFVAGADGTGSFTKISQWDFESWGINMDSSTFSGAGYHLVDVTNSSFSEGGSIVPYAIYFSRGLLAVHGGYISASVSATPVYIDNDFSGLTHITLDGMLLGGTVPFLVQASDVNTNELVISLMNNHVTPPGLSSFGSKFIDIRQAGGGSAQLIAIGNQFLAQVPGQYSTAISIAQDDLHVITGNNYNYVSATQGWKTSFPAGGLRGAYQDYTNNYVGFKINGLETLTDGTNIATESENGGNRYSDNYTVGGNWQWRYVSGCPSCAYTAKGYIDYLGNFSTAATVQSPAINFIASETGANNAIVGRFSSLILLSQQAVTGMQVQILLAHTLQAGANTFALGGGSAVAIKSHLNPANNIATGYPSGSVISLLYNGSVWLDMSQ